VTETPTLTVGVTPRSAFSSRGRLWKALESTHDVSFRGCAVGEQNGLSGLIAVHQDSVAANRGLPLLHVTGEESATETRGEVSLSEEPPLDSRLRGRLLREQRCRALRPLNVRGRAVLASVEGSAAWTAEREGWHHEASMLPAELGSHEVLRDRFRGERFLALAPILELLRHITATSAWQAPPLRAALMLDDPNLHWPSYGFADFAALANAAERHRFHLAVAAVPLDMWFAHPAAVRLFKRREWLSLLVHGNDHVRCELARELPERELLGLAAQAQRRIAGLERRTGLSVARVMAPPHGECSETMLRALRRASFDAACISRPYPWLARAPADVLSAQWNVSDVHEGCAPVIPRHPFSGDPQDVYLRAYLDQPLVLYGHHWDLEGGLDPLLGLAELVNSLGDVTWAGLGEIAAGNYLTLRRGDEYRVRLFTRRAELTVPAGIERLLVENGTGGAGETDVLEVRQQSSAPFLAELGNAFSLPSRGEPASLRLIARDAIDVTREHAPAWSAWARARRVLVEGRDRTRPLFARTRPHAGGRVR
jgi:hypothetical protein